MQKELEKNRQIYEVFGDPDASMNKTQHKLTLTDKNINDVGFLQKMLNSFTLLTVLDLSNNNLKDSGAKQVAEMLE